MGRVAAFTLLAAGVLSRNDLRESRRFGRIRFVASPAKRAGVRPLGFVRGRIFGMACQGSMAGLATNPKMPSLCSRFHNIGVAVRASLLTGEPDGLLADLVQNSAAVVTILSKRGGHDQLTRQKEDCGTCQEYQSWPDEVLGVFPFAHGSDSSRHAAGGVKKRRTAGTARSGLAQFAGCPCRPAPMEGSKRLEVRLKVW